MRDFRGPSRHNVKEEERSLLQSSGILWLQSVVVVSQQQPAPRPSTHYIFPLYTVLCKSTTQLTETDRRSHQAIANAAALALPRGRTASPRHILDSAKPFFQIRAPLSDRVLPLHLSCYGANHSHLFWATQPSLSTTCTALTSCPPPRAAVRGCSARERSPP